MHSSEQINTDTLRIHLIKGIQYTNQIRLSLSKLIKSGDRSHEEIANLVSLQMKNDLSLPRRFVVLQVFIRLREMILKSMEDNNGYVVVNADDKKRFPLHGSVNYTMYKLYTKYIESLQFGSIDEEYFKPLDFNIYKETCCLLETIVNRIYKKHFSIFY